MALGMVYMRAVELAGGLPVVLPPLAPERVAAARRAARGRLPVGRPGPRARRLRRRAAPRARPDRAGPGRSSSSASRARPTRSGCPILGICRGLQALNVARGGTLHQHLPDVTDGSIDHRQTEPAEQSRRTTCGSRRGSRLAAILGAAELRVNSFHHQAIERLGDGLRGGRLGAGRHDRGRSRATASGFVLGVQWHAEGLVGRPEHLALFETLVDAAGRARSLQAA